MHDDWLTFKVLESHFIKHNKEGAEGDAIKSLAEALSHVIKLTKEQILDNIPFDIKGHNLVEFTDSEGNAIDVSKMTDEEQSNYTPRVIAKYLELGEELSMLKIYQHLLTICNGYQSKVTAKNASRYRTEIDGKRYMLNRPLMNNHLKANDHQLPAGAMIEVMHLRERLQKKIDHKAKTEDLLDGNMSLKMNMGTLSYLLIEKGENFPESKPLRDDYIKKKGDRLRKTLTIDQYFDVCYFFLNMSIDYMKRHFTNRSGKGDHKRNNSHTIRYRVTHAKTK